MKNKAVQIIQPKTHYDSSMHVLPAKKRVCAYVRVSTDTVEQKTSFEAQRDEYTSRINNRPDWDLEGIYADEGISGTSTKNRKQFNLMIAKARNQEIDIILTKSISRFARNTVDALNYIRELRQLNVEIIFEKENISSLDPKVEFLLTIMSSLAQEEARNTSENIKWNVQRRFREGVPVINHKRFLGYTKDKKGGNLVVVPEEAKIVKLIFTLYISGMGPSSICKELMKMGVKTGSGRLTWHPSPLSVILKNEKYMGDMLQQKTLSVDYLNHKRIKNKDQAPMYYTENSHEAIIDRETFELAQRIRIQRAKARMGDDKNVSKYTRTYPLSAMIVCKECGRTLKRRYWNYGKSSQKVMQQCGSYIDGKANCKAKASSQDLIEGATIQMLNEVFLKDMDVLDTFKKAMYSTFEVSDSSANISRLKKEKESLETSIAKLVDTKITTPDLPEAVFNIKYQEYLKELQAITANINKLELEDVRNKDVENRLDMIQKILKKKQLKLDFLDADILRTLIFKMISVSPSEIVYFVAGNKHYSDKTFSEQREELLKRPNLSVGTYEPINGLGKMNYRVVIL